MQQRIAEINLDHVKQGDVAADRIITAICSISVHKHGATPGIDNEVPIQYHKDARHHHSVDNISQRSGMSARPYF